MGTWPPGNQVRRNFKRKGDAIAALAALEAEVAGETVERRLQQTALSAEQLSDAEAALQGLRGRRLSEMVGHYLSIEARAKAKGMTVDILRHTSISYQAMRDKNEGASAFNNGTSKAMMDRHYREVVEDANDVAALWAITLQSLVQEKIMVQLPCYQDTDWPSRARLKKLVWEKPMSHIAKEIGVSDVALKKQCVKLGLDLPPRGYWLRGNR